MCDGYSSMIMQVGGAYQSAVAAKYSAKSERRNLELQADAADLQGRLSDMRAEGALVQGQKQEQASRLDTRNINDKARVGYAGNGVALDSETVARVLTSTEVLGEIETNTIHANAVRTAWGYQTDAVNYRNEANIARTSAASISPRQAAMTSLIGSAGNISQSFISLKKAGAFDLTKPSKKGKT